MQHTDTTKRTGAEILTVRTTEVRHWLSLPYVPYLLMILSLVAIWIAFGPSNTLFDFAILAPREDLSPGVRRLAVVSACAFFPAVAWSMAFVPTVIVVGVLHRFGRTSTPRVVVALLYATPLLAYSFVVLVTALLAPL